MHEIPYTTRMNLGTLKVGTGMLLEDQRMLRDAIRGVYDFLQDRAYQISVTENRIALREAEKYQHYAK